MASDQSQALPPLETSEPDPELLALPAPPKRERALTIALMLLTSIAAGLLAWSLRSEADYALASGSPREMGDLKALSLDPSIANTYVRGGALLGTQGAIRYGRAAEGDTFRLAPVIGHDKLWVEIRVPEGFEGPRFIPPTQFAGRLVPFNRAGLRHASLRGAVSDKTQVTVPADAWILVDSSSPRASRWALAFVVLFAGFAAWNLIAAVRLIARVRDGLSE
ncbi:MAG: hypothetical protein JNL21_17330 [Myxococcales bacterium]|nr:hypothetical protein [Myxococcales bacterium]